MCVSSARAEPFRKSNGCVPAAWRHTCIAASAFSSCSSYVEAGSYLRLIDFCITQLKAQGPARTCNESKEEEEAPPAWRFGSAFRVSGFGFRVSGLGFGFRVSGFGFRVSGFGYRVPGLGSGFQVSRLPRFRFRVSGFGYRVPGLSFGFQVSRLPRFRPAPPTPAVPVEGERCAVTEVPRS